MTTLAYQQVLAQLILVLREQTGDEGIGPDTLLGEVFNFDSLGLVELVMLLEETFACELEDDMRPEMSVSSLALRIFDSQR